MFFRDTLCNDFLLQKLGHMTGPPVFIGEASPYIMLNYTSSDSYPEREQEVYSCISVW